MTMRCLRPGLVGLYDFKSPILDILGKEAIERVMSGGPGEVESSRRPSAASIAPAAILHEQHAQPDVLRTYTLLYSSRRG